MTTQNPRHHHHAHAGERDHTPTHAGVDITFDKVTAQMEGGLIVTSPALNVEGWIDPRFSADGGNVSPVLAWSGAQEGVAAYALIVEDPDAPRALPFIHWLIWNIPGEAAALPEAIAATTHPALPTGPIQGRNDMGTIGWFGPQPPAGHGVHRYHFQLFALSERLTLPADADLNALTNALKATTLLKGDLVGLFETAAA